MQDRAYRFDNMRAILIFLVVFGHLLEVFGGTSNELYLVIYSFHIPAFLFLTGYFASFDIKKILKHLVLPYVVFQTLYLLFQSYVIENGKSISLQFVTPYWLLWYLLTAIVYFLLLPMLKTESKKRALITWSITVVISLLIGFDKTIGYFFSLSRTIVFFPFFVGGFYLRNVWASDEKLDQILSNRKIRWTVGGVAAVIWLALEFILIKTDVSAQMAYGSFSYAQLGYGPLQRLLLGAVATLWIVGAIFLIPNQRIFAITRLGENTMSVYLLHGFCKKLLEKYTYDVNFTDAVNILLALGITVIILLLFANDWVRKIFKKLF